MWYKIHSSLAFCVNNIMNYLYWLQLDTKYHYNTVYRVNQLRKKVIERMKTTEENKEHKTEESSFLLVSIRKVFLLGLVLRLHGNRWSMKAQNRWKFMWLKALPAFVCLPVASLHRISPFLSPSFAVFCNLIFPLGSFSVCHIF